ncbi:hypothetical protein D3C77_406200 [compost metagenome]
MRGVEGHWIVDRRQCQGAASLAIQQRIDGQPQQGKHYQELQRHGDHADSRSDADAEPVDREGNHNQNDQTGGSVETRNQRLQADRHHQEYQRRNE